MGKFKLGLSYGSFIQCPDNLSIIDHWKVDVIELPLSRECDALIDQVEERGCSFSLHIPSYELIEALPYVMDMKMESQILEYTGLVEKWLPLRKPEYLVAHFPVLSSLRDPEKVMRLNMLYAAQLHKIACEHDICLYFENVAVHRAFYLPEAYASLVRYCDGICFDLGHAYTLDETLFKQVGNRDYLSDFFTANRDSICCIHLYNSPKYTNGAFSSKLHYPFVDYPEEAGFMDTAFVTQQIQSLPNLQYVIHEPHRKTVDLDATYSFGAFGTYKL